MQMGELECTATLSIILMLAMITDKFILYETEMQVLCIDLYESMCDMSQLDFQHGKRLILALFTPFWHMYRYVICSVTFYLLLHAGI